MTRRSLPSLSPEVTSLVEAARVNDALPPDLHARLVARIDAALPLVPGGVSAPSPKPTGPTGPSGPTAGHAVHGAAHGRGAVHALGSVVAGRVPLGLAMYLLGGASGVLGYTALHRAPRPPAPRVVIERVVERAPVPVPVPVATAAPPDVPAPAPALPAEATPARPAAAAPGARDAEGPLVRQAQTAVLRGLYPEAIEVLHRLAERDPQGARSEERESLWVQALVGAGRDAEARGRGGAAQFAEARARAARFHQRFPGSLFGPTVDAAIGAIP